MNYVDEEDAIQLKESLTPPGSHYSRSHMEQEKVRITKEIVNKKIMSTILIPRSHPSYQDRQSYWSPYDPKVVDVFVCCPAPFEMGDRTCARSES